MRKMMNAVMTIAVLAVIAWGQGIPATGLVAWYPLAGYRNYNDYSGNGNNLYVNMPGSPLNFPDSVSDRFGNAASADSFYNNQLIASARSLPTGDSDRTISLWVRPWILQTTQCIFYYGDTTPGKYCKIETTIDTPSGGSLRRLHISNGLSELSVLCVPYISSTRPSIGEKSWNHIAVTITKNETKIYTNNRLDTTGQITGWNTTKDSLSIGACKRILSTGNMGNIYPFWGRIDDISVYNRALSATQITQLYNAKSFIEPTSIIINRALTKKTSSINNKIFQWYDARGRTIKNTTHGILINGQTKKGLL